MSIPDKCFLPYLLKEYRNRWFLVGRQQKHTKLLTLALDRIVQFEELTKEPFISYDGVDLDRYFSELIGVTKSQNDRAHKVILL